MDVKAKRYLTLEKDEDGRVGAIKKVENNTATVAGALFFLFLTFFNEAGLEPKTSLDELKTKALFVLLAKHCSGIKIIES